MVTGAYGIQIIGMSSAFCTPIRARVDLAIVIGRRLYDSTSSKDFMLSIASMGEGHIKMEI